ncbi:MAG: hypothetical protein K2F87_01205 [Muribaculaceae bacterium]|nr:hypothetical protein [Muribaculaceae bacterium]
MITKTKKAKRADTKEKTFTVADILMVLGFVALAITTYMGTKLLTGDLMESIITSAEVVGASALLLWIICTAKKAHNHRQGWMLVEVLTLLTFIILFFSLFTERARHFEYMTNMRDSLYIAATHDKEEILGLFTRYEQQEKTDMGTIYNSMKSLPVNRSLYMDAETRERVKTWEGKNALKHNQVYTSYQLNKAAGDYIGVLENNVLFGPQYRNLKATYTDKLDSVVKSFERGTDYGKYREMATLMKETYYPKVAKELSALSGKGDLKFEMYSDAYGVHSRLLSRTYEANPDNLQLNSYFDGKARATAAGWWYTAAVFCLILCAYFATKRSRRVTVMTGFFKNKRSFTNDGGIDIC